VRPVAELAAPPARPWSARDRSRDGAPQGGELLGGEPLDDEPGPDASRCLALYAKLTAGVAVVTASGADGPTGLTVSAVTSLSARPPLLLVCLHNGSGTLAAIRANGAFAVHLLREEQGGRAALFADPGATPRRRFAGADTRQVLGVPVFQDALAWSVCLADDLRRYGDHHLVVGRVAAVHVGEGRPLLWHDRAFRSLEPDPWDGG
jgi:flavin reductase (DIM6/NTAB) family NADH-FMN oxidoreductase RutF